MYGHLRPSLLHQCPSGGVYGLPVAATYQVLNHTVSVSYPCTLCGQRFAHTLCPTGLATTPVPITRTPPPTWLPVLKAVVSAECPACGLAINLSDTIANDPEASERERVAAEEFGNGVAVVGGIALLFVGLAWLAGQSKPA